MISSATGSNSVLLQHSMASDLIYQFKGKIEQSRGDVTFKSIHQCKGPVNKARKINQQSFKAPRGHRTKINY